MPTPAYSYRRYAARRLHLKHDGVENERGGDDDAGLKAAAGAVIAVHLHIKTK